MRPLPRFRAARVLRRGLPLLATLFLLLADIVLAAPPQSRRPELPELHLAGPQHGEAAIQALGRQLPAVAAHYRLSAERLADILRQDRSAWLDASGHLFYVDEFPAPSATTADATTATALDLGQTFLLHSRPGAARVIYLDFNGHTASNSAWSNTTINALPFDEDGNAAAFSDLEKEHIQQVWQRVAEDYAPFDVDVTTEEPAPDALRRTSSSDNNYGTRVVITRNTFYNCSCGGVAYVGVFDWYSSSNPDYYQPAWVFYDALGGNEKNIAEAAAHEAGHTLGLSHDGTSTTGYYAGHGSGATGWAPIMGVGYYRELTQWSKGEYPDANNTEDDLAIIPANGAPTRNDDVGNSFGSAALLTGTSSSGSVGVNQSGIIERGSDVDVFRFVSGAGPVQLVVSPAVRGPNLDIAANLYDGNGTLLASVNPVDALGATLNATVAGGTYYLALGGTGKGDLATGYSDYGSLGQYRISGSYPDSGAQPPQAVISATPQSGTAPLVVAFDASASSDPDGSIVTYAWSFGDGGSASGVTAQHTYTTGGSYNATLTVTDSQGLTATAGAVIGVAANTPTLHVDNIAMSVGKLFNRYQCVATVSVKNGSGGAVSGVAVSGAWSGVTSSSASTSTNSSGIATLKSSWTTKRGTCTFTVGNLTLSGYSYAPAQNLETFDSFTY